MAWRCRRPTSSWPGKRRPRPTVRQSRGHRQRPRPRRAGRPRRAPAADDATPCPPGHARAARPVFDLKLDWKPPGECRGSENGPSRAASRASADGPRPGARHVRRQWPRRGQRKGRQRAARRAATVFELPTVFADPKLELEAFAADLDWRSGADGLQVSCSKAAFHNKDAAGEAKGDLAPCPKGPGRDRPARPPDARQRRGRSGATCRWWSARTCATGCAARSSAARPTMPR
jgi:hypothetical protein